MQNPEQSYMLLLLIGIIFNILKQQHVWVYLNFLMKTPNTYKKQASKIMNFKIIKTHYLNCDSQIPQTPLLRDSEYREPFHISPKISHYQQIGPKQPVMQQLILLGFSA
ncbi:transmembrane protein, putative (macronuclear) [Tetrahymena thermophila SB210]|uniref:Transmembrane protein, putative n=1 Tax=Tetrahymena thermophila (strain SB210) TaxID=312017 RepID=W7XHP6_TETTS|nr:transmembrane protein, putative [Tetrahymena thermophila SB210]EWS76813.1 transmembrane protein, putative [Tetrahymena thermophila SB210]|eukprot:XP_012650652.1 transmembrane protein, putative [Tetrahymena thermophila SB210]